MVVVTTKARYWCDEPTPRTQTSGRIVRSQLLGAGEEEVASSPKPQACESLGVV
jgi:hypothetical protein